MIKKLFFFLLLFAFSRTASSQPTADPDRWIHDSSKSDEFNGSDLDTTKWWQINACTFTNGIPHGYNGGDGAFFIPQNVSVESGNLVLKVDYNQDSLSDSFPCVHYSRYPFYSGGIISTLTNGGPGVGGIGSYSYGYYEMRAKLPGYFDTNGHSIGQGFWPTFWLFYQYPGNGCMQVHDEFDIIDSGPDIYQSANAVGSGLSDENGACGADGTATRPVLTGLNPLFAGYHKYALELRPDKVAFYFDDQPYYMEDTISYPWLAHALKINPYLALVVSMQMGGNLVEPRPLSTTPFPIYMYIDYIRYYGLNPDYNPGNWLGQNFPNPTKNKTKIEYSVDMHSGPAFISIYNSFGFLLKSFPVFEKGKLNMSLDVSDMTSGIYFYSLTVDHRIYDTRKMIVIK